MVAAGNHVHAGGENFAGGFGRDAGAAGGVFTVGNDEIERMCFTESGQEFLDRAPAGLPHDIANEEQFHGLNLTTKNTKRTIPTGLPFSHFSGWHAFQCDVPSSWRSRCRMLVASAVLVFALAR